MIQHYQLNHFPQVYQSTNIQSETDEELTSVLGKSLEFSMKTSPIPRTILYSSRTDNELANIEEIQMTLKKRLAKILHLNRITLVCTPLLNFERTLLSFH